MLDFYPDTIYAPLQRGIDLGYFEAEGIDLEIVPSSGSALTLQELSAGNVDFAFSSFARYAQDRVENDGESRAIYAYFNTATVGVVARFEVEDPEDMVGKRFGTVPFSAGRVQLPYVLEANGVAADDVSIELMDFSVLYTTLFDGGIESAEMHLPGEDGLIAEAESQGVTLHFKRLADWGFKDYSKTLLASGSVMADNPELVRRMVRAIDRSLTDALANATPEEIYNSLRKLDEQATEEAAAAGWENVVKLMDGEPGELSEDVAEYVLELSTSASGATTDLEPGDLYTNDFLP
jgi:NitT/TauT family transport system substrate-binding protein